ncbi:MAG: alpha/beta hydrolase [Nocardiopsaceae bacterium]|nr:alpha/beta hydrolase [Nocardiopsaceae bacterium]
MDTFTASDGVEIAYYQWGHGSDRPLVVLHHGFIANADANWVAPGIVDALLAAGRRVAAVDARGHGASGKPHDRAKYGEARMAQDLSMLLDILGEPQVDLVGYSMGAVVSLILAAKDTRIRRLVVGGVGAAAVEIGGVDRRVLNGPSVLEALTADDPADITDQGAAAFRVFADAVGGDRFALAAQAASMHRAPIALEAITAPALVLAGDGDELATRPEVLAGAIPGGSLRVVSGDHLGAVRDPDFAKAITEFLAG